MKDWNINVSVFTDIGNNISIYIVEVFLLVLKMKIIKLQILFGFLRILIEMIIMMIQILM